MSKFEQAEREIREFHKVWLAEYIAKMIEIKHRIYKKATIVTKITKELLESKDITDNERNVAIQFQMSVDRLKLLRKLGVSFDLLNDCLTNPAKIQNQFKEDLANLYNRKGRRKK